MVRRIFEAVGEVIELEEKLFSAFSVIASCSPAYTLLYVDALAQAGVQFGIPKPLALKIASQAVLGTTRLLQETGEHPRALARSGLFAGRHHHRGGVFPAEGRL